ncbi:MAG: ABC transporter permease [Pseudomonadota bacterium]
MELLAGILFTLTIASTPLVYAALGELVVERSGVLNLGVEGMMIIGAIGGFAVAYSSGSVAMGVFGGVVAGATLALLFGAITQIFLANQVVTGLALTIFGLGISALIGQAFTGQTLDTFPRLYLPVLSEVPILGKVVFQQDILVYGSIALTAAVWWTLTRTRLGLIIRAVGEDHEAAHALGFPVIPIRLAVLAFGGGCAGLGGAYLSLVQTPIWVEDMTAGRGWIALAIVVFAAWRPWRVLLGAYLFGGFTIIQLHAQAFGVNISPQYLSMIPYIVTILVLVAMSTDTARRHFRAPACLGKTFFTVR